MRRLSQTRILASATLAAYAACAGPVLHKTGGATFPARQPGCQFQVLGSSPGPGYVEVGQITIEGIRTRTAGVYYDPQEFANDARDQICAAGGDTLLTEVNGVGMIARGIVFHHVATDEGPPERAPATTVQRGACEPICSPGFLCNAGTCIPQCNPACVNGETCGNDRICHRNGNQ